MAEIPRLNGVIRALEQGKTACVGFGSVDNETATALAASNLDGVAFEMEHAPMSSPALRDALQSMLDRRQIVDSGSLAPKVTPMVRIPPNGGEMNQWIAKQVLDIGVYGIIFPPVSNGEEARNAARARRDPPLPAAPRPTACSGHPVVAPAIDRILTICKDHNVPCGHPHPDAKNIERLIASGYRFLMPSTPRSFGVLEQGRKLAGRV